MSVDHHSRYTTRNCREQTVALGGGFSLCACSSSSYSRPEDDLEQIQYAVLSILPLEFTRTMNIVFVMPDACLRFDGNRFKRLS